MKMIGEYNDSKECVANWLVRDVLGLKVRWFNLGTSRWRLGTIIRIERHVMHIRAKDKAIYRVQWGFVELPQQKMKGEG